MSDFSFIANAHPSFIETMYEKYQADPLSVDASWASFFKGFEYAKPSNGSENGATHSASPMEKEFGVMSIIHGFRDRGHLLSTTNPIRNRRDRKPHLDLGDYNLSDADLQQTFQAGKEIGLENATLQQILDKLKEIYAGNIGFEVAHIENKAKREWLRTKIEERKGSDYGYTLDQKKRILEKLNGAVGFENFLDKKYVGQKRFSLEGGETAIAALDAIINMGAEKGVKEVVIGMAHRGRLNVLANIMQKTYEHIFNEFEGNAIPDQSFGDGDVKYHLGYSSQTKTASGKKIDLKLAPNPSHLEAVNPVVEGFARAKADLLYGSDYDKILPILIHGDAAVVGQGVVYETVQMSQLDGYYTGGTMHLVINNQVGFTTDFDDARSSTYCTAAASLVQAPVFHVNGDDPEAVVWAVELATAYRQEFNNDVFIDMVCYRKHGHNEGDDPKFTQPTMYSKIKNHPNPREIYLKKMLERNDITKADAEKMEQSFWDDLQKKLDKVKEKPLPYQYQTPELDWKKLNFVDSSIDFPTSPPTGIKKSRIKKILKHLQNNPDNIDTISKVNRLLKGAAKLLDIGKLDWALAELMAYASILLDNKDVRMSGQDVKRGTFSHRHAVFRDENTGEEYNRINSIQKKQGTYRIYNSLLSEFAVLGFEYGYSLASPNSLVIWEAQFGDFYNGAQSMVDQFISAGESKWRRMSGLVMLLPHGYEGQGPEHSSARFERFLQMAAEFNIIVTNISTPANFFHAMRRQLAFDYRKPLINMSPKSLLRHPRCVSDIEAFEDHKDNSFYEYYDDPDFSTRTAKNATRVILCTGKIYYDLLEKKEELGNKTTAIIRIEQLYPFPKKMVDKLFKKYKNADRYWVQEEPENMGAWKFVHYIYPDMNFIARKPSASPATGFKKVHEKQQKAILTKAFKK
jgi:2-oxoglutarate dehydrogenase E1 component